MPVLSRVGLMSLLGLLLVFVFSAFVYAQTGTTPPPASRPTSPTSVISEPGNQTKQPTTPSTPCTCTYTPPTKPKSAGPRADGKMRILICVNTAASRIERRALIRQTWASPERRPDNVDVMFVVGESTGVAQPGDLEIRPNLDLSGLQPIWNIAAKDEARVYGDILLLPIPENGQNGKVYNLFKYVYENMPGRYDMVFKADDDTYMQLDRVVAELEGKEPLGIYYGYRYLDYMAGWLAGVSWDLVKFIATDPRIPSMIVGHEDLLMGKWLHLDNDLIKQWFNFGPPKIHDQIWGGINDPMDWSPKTFCIHRVKKPEHFLYFAELDHNERHPEDPIAVHRPTGTGK
ncbi:hypothetical protein PAPYR_10040 [Paratrimastix pyriformis]|uniref:Hexosyltransferase n=1 Tax=Paratrimastix pyriformis TaxID=342808 RepID=A0ABQ8U6T3_9EUKA|nr:hypothetical protein PAPYR_10040 [Paratrimastix pyriformis]